MAEQRTFVVWDVTECRECGVPVWRSYPRGSRRHVTRWRHLFDLRLFPRAQVPLIERWRLVGRDGHCYFVRDSRLVPTPLVVIRHRVVCGTTRIRDRGQALAVPSAAGCS